jgi:hypothetical protein
VIGSRAVVALGNETYKLKNVERILNFVDGSFNVVRYPSTGLEGVQKTTRALNSTEGVWIGNRTGHILNQTLKHSSSIWARRKEILVDNFFCIKMIWCYTAIG